MRGIFQPTLPARGATCVGAKPPRGERRNEPSQTRQADISTHAPREGSDVMIQIAIILIRISTHAPREGSDFVSAVR